MMISEAALEAIGYLGGGILSICLVPQIGKIVITRSTRDISVWWSLMYITGLALTMAYLIMKDAMAAWLPLIIEVAGCLTIIGLKIFIEGTTAGQKWSLKKQLPPDFNEDASIHSIPGISHVISIAGATEEGNWRAAVDKSWRGGRPASAQHDVNSSKRGSLSQVEIRCCNATAESTNGTNNESTAATAGSAVTTLCPATVSDAVIQLPTVAVPAQQQQDQGLFHQGWTGLQAVHPIQRPQHH